MAESVQTVTYALNDQAPAWQQRLVSALPFDDTVERLKQAIAEQDLWLIHEINPQMLLRRGGYGIGAVRQLLFFHPRYMARLLSINVDALVEAPLKLVVMEMPDGAVTVRYPDPEMLFERYRGLAGLAAELATLYQRIVQPIVGEGMGA